MGYDPFDFFDLGGVDQRGGVPTWFGTKAELVGLITAAHARGMQVYADAVYNHMSGGDMEHNPDFNCDRWTRFSRRAGGSRSTTAAFIPAATSASTGRHGAHADLCHNNPTVYSAVMDHAAMLIAEVGFDGFRFDFVKGYGAWTVRRSAATIRA